MDIAALAALSPSLPTEVDHQVAVIKKARNIKEDTAAALLELVKQQPVVNPGAGRINTYA